MAAVAVVEAASIRKGAAGIVAVAKAGAWVGAMFAVGHECRRRCAGDKLDRRSTSKPRLQCHHGSKKGNCQTDDKRNRSTRVSSTLTVASRYP